MGVFTETRVQTLDGHTHIANALKRSGYLAISHNAPPKDVTPAVDTLDEAFLGPRAAGVIIVVSERHTSGWADIAFDSSGRAIAASLDTSDGSMVRIVGAYGVSGANCTNFTSFPLR